MATKKKVPLDRPRMKVSRRLAEADMTKADLSRALGKNETYIQQWIEYGVPRQLPEFVRYRICALLDIDHDDLLDDEQRVASMKPIVPLPPPKRAQNPALGTPAAGLFDLRDTIPIYASAEGGDGHLIASTDEIGRAPRPDVLRGVQHAYAILVTGTSMIDAYEPGDRALVNAESVPLRDTDVILYSVDEEGQAVATIKRLLGWTDADWHLKQNNPPRTFKLSKAKWGICHQVVGNLKRHFGGRIPFGAI